MAEETAKDTELTSFGDLDAVLKDQQKTIQTLTEKIESDSSDVFNEPIFGTSPTAPPKPTNFVVIILIGVIIFMLLRRK